MKKIPMVILADTLMAITAMEKKKVGAVRSRADRISQFSLDLSHASKRISPNPKKASPADRDLIPLAIVAKPTSVRVLRCSDLRTTLAV